RVAFRATRAAFSSLLSGRVRPPFLPLLAPLTRCKASPMSPSASVTILQVTMAISLASGRRTLVTRCAKNIIAAGGLPRDVQELAGHASLSTTQRYIQGDTEAKRKVVDL